MLDLVLIGARIADLRKQSGFTQYELADKLYVTHQAVSKWENGKSLPSIEILYDLTQLFKVSIDYLIDHTDIDDKDYERLLKSYPRAQVLESYLNGVNQKEDLDLIFYLLDKDERTRVIYFAMNHPKDLPMDKLWPYLNKIERSELLGNILSGKCQLDLTLIKGHLTEAEQMTVQKMKGLKNVIYMNHD